MLILDSVEGDPRGTAWLKAQAAAAAAAAADLADSSVGSGEPAPASTAAPQLAGAASGTPGLSPQPQPSSSSPPLRTAGSAGTADGLQLGRTSSVRRSGSFFGAAAPAGVGAGGRAGEVAVGVLRNFRPFLQDISSVRRVMETLLSWLDANGRCVHGAPFRSALCRVRVSWALLGLVEVVHDRFVGGRIEVGAWCLQACAFMCGTAARA